MKPYDIKRNNDSWTKDYNIIFVDQPVGTGLSYADESFNMQESDDDAEVIPKVYCTNMSCVADDFYYALKELFTTSSGCLNQLKFKSDHSFYIFG
jgi:vitellogenic carboxypeptidase-like protein/serine carboxypeptidase 1